MQKPSWWRRLQDAVNAEYERRLRRASKLDEHGHTPHLHHAPEPAEATAEDEAVIVNLPRGVRTQ